MPDELAIASETMQLVKSGALTPEQGPVFYRHVLAGKDPTQVFQTIRGIATQAPGGQAQPGTRTAPKQFPAQEPPETLEQRVRRVFGDIVETAPGVAGAIIGGARGAIGGLPGAAGGALLGAAGDIVGSALRETLEEKPSISRGAARAAANVALGSTASVAAGTVGRGVRALAPGAKTIPEVVAPREAAEAFSQHVTKTARFASKVTEQVAAKVPPNIRGRRLANALKGRRRQLFKQLSKEGNRAFKKAFAKGADRKVPVPATRDAIDDVLQEVRLARGDDAATKLAQEIGRLADTDATITGVNLQSMQAMLQDFGREASNNPQKWHARRIFEALNEDLDEAAKVLDLPGAAELKQARKSYGAMAQSMRAEEDAVLKRLLGIQTRGLHKLERAPEQAGKRLLALSETELTATMKSLGDYSRAAKDHAQHLAVDAILDVSAPKKGVLKQANIAIDPATFYKITDKRLGKMRIVLGPEEFEHFKAAVDVAGEIADSVKVLDRKPGGRLFGLKIPGLSTINKKLESMLAAEPLGRILADPKMRRIFGSLGKQRGEREAVALGILRGGVQELERTLASKYGIQIEKPDNEN